MIEYAIVGVFGAYEGVKYLINHIGEMQLRTKWRELINSLDKKKDEKHDYQLLKVIKTQYGFQCLISLPAGSSYDEFEKIIPKVESWIGCVSENEWKRFDHCIELKLATAEYDEDEPFEPVQTVGPWELFCGETYFREKLKADMTEMAHILTAGSTGSGKSCCLFIIITNLAYWHDDIDIYLAQVSDKQDLAKFKNLKQTRYFAHNLQTTDWLIQYLLKLQNDRNKELNKYGLDNIGQYNKRFKSHPMRYSYLFIDEFSSLMPGENKNIDPNYTIKKRIIYNLHELIRQARSAGIFVITSLQRPSKDNLDPSIKNLLNVKIAFRANNIASSKVLLDSEEAWNLPNRTALYIGSYQKILKTPKINDEIMNKYLDLKRERDHKYIKILSDKGIKTNSNEGQQKTPIKDNNERGLNPDAFTSRQKNTEVD